MKSKLRLTGAFAALAVLVVAVGCKGFFVKPTLTAVAVQPISPTIFTSGNNTTVQMSAIGTFNDNSSGSTPVSWSVSGTSSSGQNIATITPGGLVTAVATGTGTITATSQVLPTISGTQPLTVSIACTSAPVISPTGGTLTPNQPTLSFTASCNGGQSITSVASWVSSNTAIATVSAGVVTAIATTGDNGTFTITASNNGFTSTPVSITASGF